MISSKSFIEKILNFYGLASAEVTPFGNGLINNTWKVQDGNNAFILQKINTSIFKHPQWIAENINSISKYLSQQHPEYFFLTSTQTLDGKDLVETNNEYFRMFPFVKNSHTINVSENPEETYEAAKKFGELTKLLSSFPVNSLKITLPDFHNLSLRYQQFQQAISSGNKERLNQSKDMIDFLNSHEEIVTTFEKIKKSANFKLRVTHHDTKINNILFNDEQKGICVIDLDTLMPGYFISDVGDMMRTHISPVSEEEKDVSKIVVRDEYFVALAKGYLSKMHDELSEDELNHFVYAGKFMIYMQALRFLTDHLNNDIYYGAAYENQNYYRTINQCRLLQLLTEKESYFNSIVAALY